MSERTLAATVAIDPDRAAVIDFETGSVTTYAQLDAASARVAALLRSLEIKGGDHVALLMDNTPRYLEMCWAMQRSGVYYTPINWHLTADEAQYIIDDCGAVALFASSGVGDLAKAVGGRNLRKKYCVDGVIEGYEDLDAALGALPADAPLPEPIDGMVMFYSSGTTGRPKGILRAYDPKPYGTPSPLDALMEGLFGFRPTSTYLCPAPLYHAAPLGWSMGTLRLGGTVVVLRSFDPLKCLSAIERYRVTKAQFVPTMFIRMLKLSADERSQFDISSLETAIHAAAPCPAEVKDQMIGWWGPIIEEYYAGSEGNGFCYINSPTWLAHRGSVGRPVLGSLHIVDEDGNEMAQGEIGTVYFEGTAAFEYHNDPEKTKSAFNDKGWSTLGDVGHVDSEGFLFLSDRRSHLIISGGVNIYPQEVENVLTMHPLVADVAVIGVPDAEMGESVKAVVQLVDMSLASPALGEELTAYCREHLAKFKCPRSVDFDADLPRLPTGKLFKRRLYDRYR